MELKIYDGAEEIGGSKIYLREGEHGVFLDFGLNFNVRNLYFKEFISMRSIRGLNDPIEMGLLPKIRTYRKDLIPSDLNTEDFEKIPVDAVLITHAHLDHYGMIGYLDFSIPIVASPETVAIIKAYQDAGKSDIGTSVIYTSKRIKKQSSVPILKSTGSNIKNNSKKETVKKYLKLRKLIPTEALSNKFQKFLYTHNGDGKTDFVKENLEIGNLKELPFKITVHSVDHSIYGAVGYVIEGDSSKIAYTGDLRFHGERKGDSERFTKAAKNCEVLIVEGTRVAEDREHNYTSEKEVFENSSDAVSSEKGLVIADFSARNFERLNMFSKIAQENGRHLVITEKDAYAVNGLLASGTKINTENLLVYNKPSDRIEWWSKELRKDPLWEDRYVGALDIRASPKDYILAFSLYDMPNLMDIKTTDGLYLYSSTEAFNEEMELDFETLWNWLKRYEFRSVGFKFDNGKLCFEKGYHASGHASAEDLEKMISEIDPEKIIPVHTNNPEWFKKKFDGITKVLKNGGSMKF